MRALSLLILGLFAFVQCKKDSRDPAPEIASIVGKWRVVEYRRVSGDSTVTQPVPKANSYVYEFRYDGALLNEAGFAPCCFPKMYSLNGKPFVPKPAKPVELDPICALSLCAYCPDMQLTLVSPDSLVMEQCHGSFTTFTREK